MPERKRHPIRVVARRTGLSPEILRVWEKRYGAVEPGRTESGRRLYSDKDIERLRLIRKVTFSGHRVGEVSSLPIQALEALSQEDESSAATAPTVNPHPRSARGPDSRPGIEADRSDVRISPSLGTDLILEECLDAMRDLDAPRLEAILARSLANSGSISFIDDLVRLLLRTIGDLWEQGRIDPHHEHLVTGVVRQTIARHVFWQATGGSAPRAVVCTPSGQLHELGALLAASALSAAGWQVIYLGADLPARDIARAAQQTGAGIVALSIIHPGDDPKLIAELSILRDRLPEGVKIIVGGGAAASYAKTLRKIGAEVAQDVRGLSAIPLSTPTNAPARSPQGDGQRTDRSGAGS